MCTIMLIFNGSLAYVFNDATTKELLYALDANAAAVSAIHSARLVLKSEQPNYGVVVEFVWSGDQTKTTTSILPLSHSQNDKLPDSNQIVSSKSHDYIVDKLTLNDGKPVDPRKQTCEKSIVFSIGSIANRGASALGDRRSALLLLHPVSALPRSKQYIAKDLLSVASRYSLRRVNDEAKPNNRERIELDLEFSPKEALDYYRIILRFDPKHGYHCDFRETHRKEKGISTRMSVAEFTQISSDQFFPKTITSGAKEINQRMNTTNVEVVEINGTLSDQEFSVPFPENSYISDLRNDTFWLLGKGGVPQTVLSKSDFRRLHAASQVRNAKPRSPLDPKRIARSIDWGWWLSTVSIVAGISAIIAAVVFRIRMN